MYCCRAAVVNVGLDHRQRSDLDDLWGTEEQINKRSFFINELSAILLQNKHLIFNRGKELPLQSVN